ncbi:hypothetical protein ACO0LF_09230 [Undibacterium sp. Di27W]|uniref:hypothetical protein n=1 Tax=Undibacterium sp. Di27W TaxID=3413036 RepID=UPI003BF23B55
MQSDTQIANDFANVSIKFVFIYATLFFPFTSDSAINRTVKTGLGEFVSDWKTEGEGHWDKKRTAHE